MIPVVGPSGVFCNVVVGFGVVVEDDGLVDDALGLVVLELVNDFVAVLVGFLVDVLDDGFDAVDETVLVGTCVEVIEGLVG